MVKRAIRFYSQAQNSIYVTLRWTNQSRITPNTLQINVPSGSPLYRPSSAALLFERQDLELG